MMRIPDKSGKFSQPNTSDLFGNLWVTKNLNFDESGYMKLSNRSVAIGSEEVTADIGNPLSFGRKSNGEFLVVTTDEPLEVAVSETEVSVAEDTDSGNPQLTSDSWGRWWQNRWYVTDADDLLYKSGSTWTDAGLTLTSGVCHAIEVFRNRLTLCVANGNTVQQVLTNHSLDTTLTIPADYEITCMAYVNNKVGIGTKLSDSANSQNQEAYFFVWDGGSTSANGGFPVGSDTIFAVVAYKSTWVVLTREGRVLMFNGGGFDELFVLPMHDLDVTWGDPVNKQIFGDALVVEGDKIYVNLNFELNLFGNKSEEVKQNCLGGVYCYDPAVGLYHRYSPSVSLASLLTVTDANVNTTTDILTKTAGTIPTTGNPIKYVSDKASQIGGLMVGDVYYVIRHTSTTFSLAATKQDALDGNKINLTSTGSSNNYFLGVELVDYAPSRLSRTAGIGLFGQENQVADHLIFGGEYQDINSTNDYYTICITVAGFKNIGYFITPRVGSDGITDNNQNVTVKFRQLGPDDEIIVKYKKIDVRGIPVTTPQRDNIRCTWTNATTFTTTADISEVDTYLDTEGNECEAEIIAGAGAGQMSQITSVSESGGTYTVVLQDEIEGVTAGYTCDVLIDNWKYVGTVTADDTDGYKTLAVGQISKGGKFKVILKGVNITIEEFSGATINHIPL